MTGAPIPSSVVEPTRAQLFQFSAATWNAHRIHYDPDYARKEGYPDVLVQSHLHACFLMRALRGATGDQVAIERFRWRNRGIAVPGDRLTITGRATATEQLADGVRIQYELDERNQRGDVCASAWATVRVPR